MQPFHHILAVVLAIFACRPASAQTADTSLQQRALRETVVAASRLTESLLHAPVSIEQLSARDARMMGAPSFYDALEYLRGVQMLTPSLGFKVVNTRGFANTTNVRFAQLIDGADNQAPHIGAPIANALGVNELDLEKAEIVPGTASALYGLNALNGLLNLQTKNPFTSEGIQIRQVAGLNHLGNVSDISPQFYGETNFRLAKVLHPKLAIKLNATWTGGYDWIADDTASLAVSQNAFLGLTGPDNPAYDPVNGYGNESPNRRTLRLDGKNVAVARTGYRERDVTDYRLNNLKGDLGVYFRPGNGSAEWSYTFRAARIDNTYQRANRFRMEDYRLSQHVLRYQSPFFQGLAYLTGENTGQTYNLRSAAENIDRAFKSDNAWFADYQTAYNSAVQNGIPLAQAHRMARLGADAGRPQPGSAAFQTLLDSLADINNWDQGAALRVRAQLAHAEGVAQWHKLFKNAGAGRWTLMSGFDYRTYIIVPDGNYFINPGDESGNLTYGKTGGFVQAGRAFWRDRLRLSLALRADKADYFNWRFNPRVTATFSPNSLLHVRAAYQSGYRFPSIFEGFSNVNSGGVRRVGGLRIMSNGIFENSWLRSSIDAFQAAVNNSVNTEGLTQGAAIEKHKGLLQRNPYTYLRPEYVRSFETGIRLQSQDKKLFLDAEFYYNIYRDFIAQVEANIPRTSDPDSIPHYLFTRGRQDRYRLWTNSQTTVYNFGGGLGLRYQFNDRWTVQTNATYARLDRRAENDGLEDGFNTPRWILNGTVYANGLWKTLSGSLTARWQRQYNYQSFLVNGEVPAFWALDGQLSYFFDKTAMALKLGGTNLLNKGYRSMLGGPNVGGLYYLSATWYFE